MYILTILNLTFSDFDCSYKNNFPILMFTEFNFPDF